MRTKSMENFGSPFISKISWNARGSMVRIPRPGQKIPRGSIRSDRFFLVFIFASTHIIITRIRTTLF